MQKTWDEIRQENDRQGPAITRDRVEMHALRCRIGFSSSGTAFKT
jgi:hypothetical protein